MPGGPPQVACYVPPPGHPLQPYVDSIWRMNHALPVIHETILPKQKVDLLFNLGTPIRVVEGINTGPIELTSFHVAGPQTGAFVSSHQGRVTLLGASLRMESCSALLPLPVAELTDQSVDGSIIFPQQHFLYEQVAEAASFREQCNLLLTWLARWLQPSPHDKLVQTACWALREEPTSHSLDRVAAKLHLSSRHLRRLMLHHTGIGPAHYMRLSRFVKSLQLMPTALSLTEIAYGVYYADQAHFCRDFKEIAGMTQRITANG